MHKARWHALLSLLQVQAHSGKSDNRSFLNNHSGGTFIRSFLESIEAH